MPRKSTAPGKAPVKPSAKAPTQSTASAKTAGKTRTAAKTAKASATTGNSAKAKAAKTAISAAPSREAISVRAYEIWLRKGRPLGQDEQNWLEAESELKVKG